MSNYKEKTRTEGGLPKLNLSFSAMNSYLGCPLQFKFMYVDKLRRTDRQHLMFGSTMHAVLEEIGRREIEGIMTEKPYFPNEENMLAELDIQMEKSLSAYRKSMDEGFADPISADEVDAYRIRGAKAIKLYLKYFDNSYKDRRPSKIYIEKEIMLHPENSAFPLRGFIDKIELYTDGSARIVDYKSGREKSQEEVDLDMQLTCYSYMLNREMDILPDQLCLYFMETGREIKTSRSMADVEIFAEMIGDISEAIVMEKFEPTAGRNCAWCEFTDKCPKIILSVSQIRTILQCPKKFELEKNDTREDRSAHSKELTLYRVIDDSIATLKTLIDVQTVISEQVVTDVVASRLQVIDEELRALSSSVSVTDLPTPAELESMLGVFLRSFDPAKNVKAQSYFTCDLGAIAISGKFGDIIEIEPAKYEIVFYKTGRTPNRIFDDERFILLLYAFLAREELGLYVTKASLRYLKTDITLSEDITERSMREVAEKIAKLAEDFKIAKFTKKVNKLCGWCEQKEVC